MKIARFIGVLFGILGVVLLVGTAVLCFLSLDATAEVAQLPQAGLDCAQEVMDALGSGDWEKAAARDNSGIPARMLHFWEDIPVFHNCGIR